MLDLFFLFVSEDLFQSALYFLLEVRDLLFLFGRQFDLVSNMRREHPTKLKAAWRSAIGSIAARSFTRWSATRRTAAWPAPARRLREGDQTDGRQNHQSRRAVEQTLHCQSPGLPDLSMAWAWIFNDQFGIGNLRPA